VVGAADPGGHVGAHLQQPHVTHALEVGTHGVGVQAQTLGDVGGGERLRRPGQLEIDGVARVVAERLENIETR
jgi:hypothetical protein